MIPTDRTTVRIFGVARCAQVGCDFGGGNRLARSDGAGTCVEHGHVRERPGLQFRLDHFGVDVIEIGENADADESEHSGAGPENSPPLGAEEKVVEAGEDRVFWDS